MTIAETDRGVGLGVYVVYPELFYEIHLMSDYFTALAEVWNACVSLVREGYLGSGKALAPGPRTLMVRVHHLHIGSPMTITFAIEGGVAVLAVYTTHLFARVLRDPRRVGAWLPQLVAGWHEAWQEAEKQKTLRGVLRRGRKTLEPTDATDADVEVQVVQQHPAVRDLIEASSQLVSLNMQADEVLTIGTDKTDEDLAAFFDNDSD